MSRPVPPDVTIRVRVQPKASRDEILGLREDTWRVRVTAPPEGGRANQAVIALLAGALDIPRSRVSIERGHASRDKLVRVESLALEEVQRRLAGRAG
jgi:uncharacterized protein